MRTKILAVALLLVAVWGVFRVRHYGIKKSINTAVTAVEQEDVGRLLSVVSRMYSDDYGNDREIVGRLAERFFELIDQMRVTIASRQIDAHGGRADVRLMIKLVGDYAGMRGYVVGSMDGAEQVDLVMEKVGGAWLIVGMSSPHIEAASKGWIEENQRP